jgi:predicted DNA-binding transcriptional regulator YafY
MRNEPAWSTRPGPGAVDRTQRFQRVDELLRERPAVPMQVLLDELQVSRATVKRDLEHMRERLGAPIVWDRDLAGYRFADGHLAARQYELPGLWFNASEIHALLTMRQLLENLQPGLLGEHGVSLLARVRALIDEGEHTLENIERRIRILNVAARSVPPRHFGVVTSALLSRKRLELEHWSRQRDDVTDREVSPQRLVYYRDNWFLDAWCHRRGTLSTFPLDAVRHVSMLDRRAKNLSERTLNARLGAVYGIFGGCAGRRARLRFSPERASWVAHETWHPEQQGTFDDDGSYLLEIAYDDDRELLMDVLKFGAAVEVLGPPALREKVRDAHAAAAERNGADL